MNSKFVSSSRRNLNKMATEVRTELKYLTDFIQNNSKDKNAKFSVTKLRGLFTDYDAYYRKTIEKKLVLLPWKDETLEPRDVIDIFVGSHIYTKIDKKN